MFKRHVESLLCSFIRARSSFIRVARSFVSTSKCVGCVDRERIVFLSCIHIYFFIIIFSRLLVECIPDF